METKDKKTENKQNFAIGRTVATNGADDEIKNIVAKQLGIQGHNVAMTIGNIAKMAKGVMELRAKLITDHVSLVQGVSCDSDHKLNIEACAHEGEEDAEGNSMQTRVFSALVVGEVKFWVITEWDRSVTTILLPSEY